ncbi:uncharacterized protein [Porites lutea]|uniref:uncharacterized protein n=1 Tax=Porites lutea TaxID=51062 RepID=UPI003CC575EB
MAWDTFSQQQVGHLWRLATHCAEENPSLAKFYLSEISSLSRGDSSRSFAMKYCKHCLQLFTAENCTVRTLPKRRKKKKQIQENKTNEKKEGSHKKSKASKVSRKLNRTTVFCKTCGKHYFHTGVRSNTGSRGLSTTPQITWNGVDLNSMPSAAERKKLKKQRQKAKRLKGRLELEEQQSGEICNYSLGESTGPRGLSTTPQITWNSVDLNSMPSAAERKKLKKQRQKAKRLKGRLELQEQQSGEICNYSLGESLHVTMLDTPQEATVNYSLGESSHATMLDTPQEATVDYSLGESSHATMLDTPQEATVDYSLGESSHVTMLDTPQEATVDLSNLTRKKRRRLRNRAKILQGRLQGREQQSDGMSNPLNEDLSVLGAPNAQINSVNHPQNNTVGHVEFTQSLGTTQGHHGQNIVDHPLGNTVSHGELTQSVGSTQSNSMNHQQSSNVGYPQNNTVDYGKLMQKFGTAWSNSVNQPQNISVYNSEFMQMLGTTQSNSMDDVSTPGVFLSRLKRRKLKRKANRLKEILLAKEQQNSKPTETGPRLQDFLSSL